MLTRYYELGRQAAFSAIDAHEGEGVVFRCDDMIDAAYHVTAEMECEATGIWDLPEWWQGVAPEDKAVFRAGYYDALAETGR